MFDYGGLFTTTYVAIAIYSIVVILSFINAFMRKKVVKIITIALAVISFIVLAIQGKRLITNFDLLVFVFIVLITMPILLLGNIVKLLKEKKEKKVRMDWVPTIFIIILYALIVFIIQVSINYFDVLTSVILYVLLLIPVLLIISLNIRKQIKLYK
jgi:hypothetical protein